MLNTRANVEEYAKSLGLESIQIDEIPEGFSFKQADKKIGDKEYTGDYIAFVPLTDIVLYNQDIEGLVYLYNIENKKHG